MSAPRAPESAPEAAKALKATETRSFLISSSYVVLKGLSSASLRRGRSCPVACGHAKCRTHVGPISSSLPRTTQLRGGIAPFPAGSSPLRLHHSLGLAKGGYKGRSIAGVGPTMALLAKIQETPSFSQNSWREACTPNRNGPCCRNRASAERLGLAAHAASD